MQLKISVFGLAALLCSCGGGGSTSSGPPPGPTPSATPTPNPQAQFYQPLAVGDSWSYTCRDIKGGGENGGQPFAITNAVTATDTINGQPVFDFTLQVPQVPSAPLSVVTQTMLLNNDAQGNLTIYGYVIGGTNTPITPTVIVSATPTSQPISYAAPDGSTITRILFGIIPTNPTPLGVFQVADYEESGKTHDYGYAKGLGIAEEDHGPNYQVDCLISAVTLK